MVGDPAGRAPAPEGSLREDGRHLLGHTAVGTSVTDENRAGPAIREDARDGALAGARAAIAVRLRVRGAQGPSPRVALGHAVGEEREVEKTIPAQDGPG